MSNSDVETVERVIAAPPDEIFALLADPDRHAEFDGSGTVRKAHVSEKPLKLGSTFSMDMHKGIGYTMVNTIVELEQDRRIAWQPRPDNGVMRLFIGGRIWRYVLEPLADGSGTKVSESWDISQEKVKFAVAPLRKQTHEAMAKTLERIEQLLVP
jgi:uncharacterized protein YndB with AHSA1/START domain